MKIANLILAAGCSTRMGKPKQLLPVGKATLLGVTLKNALQSKVEKVFCVLGANADKIEKSLETLNVEFIFNPNYKLGLSSSIKTGVSHIQSLNYDAILITLGDQPFVDVNILNKMVNNYKNQPENIMASDYGDNIGIPVIVPKGYYSKFLKLSGDNGAKHYLNNIKDQITIIKNKNLIDIDTKEDYDTYLK